MVNTDRVLSLAQSIEQVPSRTPSLEAWVQRTKELNREVARRMIWLCQYADEIPESSLVDYAEVLTMALKDGDLRLSGADLTELMDEISKLYDRLIVCNREETATSVKRAIEDRMRRAA